MVAFYSDMNIIVVIFLACSRKLHLNSGEWNKVEGKLTWESVMSFEQGKATNMFMSTVWRSFYKLMFI